MNGQGALELELDPGPPEEEAVHRLTFAGDPFPMPRVRARIAGGKGKQWIQFYEPKEAEAHKDAIAGAWRAESLPTLAAGVWLGIRCVFAFARPDGHYSASGALFPRFIATRPGGGGKNGREQRTGGDVDNCVKLVLDALNKVAWADDGQVQRVIAEKFYVDQAGVLEPCTIVELWAL